MQQFFLRNWCTVPDDIKQEMELEHKARCREFAAVTLPCYRDNPSTWPSDSFDKVLSFITPYIGYLRLQDNAAVKYPNLDQLQDELAKLPTSENANYAKRAFVNNAKLHSELIAVVDDAAMSDTSVAGSESAKRED